MVRADAVDAANMGVIHVSFVRVEESEKSQVLFRAFSWPQLALFSFYQPF